MVEAPTYSIDPLTLRERPDDVDAAHSWALFLGSGSPLRDAELIGWLRMLGRLDEAEAVGWKCLAAAGGPGQADEISRGLPAFAALPATRLAHVLQWKADWVSASILLDAALSSLAPGGSGESENSRSRRRAFVLQHRGKLSLDQGRVDQALADFRSAHVIRVQLGAPEDQIHSSNLAVHEALRRQRLPSWGCRQHRRRRIAPLEVIAAAAYLPDRPEGCSEVPPRTPSGLSYTHRA